MKQLSRLLVMLLAACAGPGRARPAATPAGETVGLQLIENHVYLPATVAGKERLWILDCGAAGSVVDRGFVEELGLGLSGEVEAMGAGGSVKTGFATVPGLKVGRLVLDSQPMVVLDLVGLMRRSAGTEPAGILGHDFISRFVTRLDFAARTVTFFDPDSFRYTGPGREIPMTLNNNIPSIDMDVAGVGRGRWRLDIGASVSSFHYHSAGQLRPAERPGIERLAGMVGGRQRVRLVRLDSAGIAGFTVRHPVFAVPLEGSAGALAMTDVEGTVGNPVLMNFTLFLDYRNGRLIVEQGGDFGTEQEQDRSGLQVSLADSADFEVTWVSPGSPADQAGCRPGDVIASVDGQTAEQFGGLPGLRAMLRADPGTNYRLVVRRKDTQLNLTLVLQDIL